MTDSIFHLHVLLKRSLIALMIVFLFLSKFSTATAKVFHLEKKIRQIIASEDISTFQEDRRCPADRKYRVYMIDNFEQDVDLVPEVLTSHGEMLEKILRTGRDDIELIIMNTALSKGLKKVIRDLIEGECVDAVVSSVPGSNYTYFRSNQIAYFDDNGELAFAPLVLKQDQFVQWRAQIENRPECRFNDEVVLTAAQYSEIKWLYPSAMNTQTTKDYVWLNSPEHGQFYAFDPACWKRGTLIGTSVIPPNKLREMLPPKTSQASRGGIGKILGFLDR